MQKSVQAAAIFWPRVSQNSRSYFPIIKLSLFSHPVFVMPSKSKQIIFGRQQASGLFFKKTTQLDGCLLLCRKKKNKNIATLICTRKNYLLLLTEKKKNFPPTKRNPILIKHTAQCIYMDNFGGKKSDSLSIPVTKTIFNLDAILSQELFCIKVAMYFTLYVFVWGKKV